MNRTYQAGDKVKVRRHINRIDDWWLKRFPGYKAGDLIDAEFVGPYRIGIRDCDGSFCNPSMAYMDVVDTKRERIDRMVNGIV